MDILEQVVREGVNLAVQDENGNTALHLGLLLFFKTPFLMRLFLL